MCSRFPIVNPIERLHLFFIKGDFKMYNINDTVMYASYGVCRITSIVKRDFSGEDIEYYVLQPVSDSKNTFYVPTSFGTLRDKMRRVYSREEVEELINVMPDEKLIWIDNDSERKEAYRNIIESGDRIQLVKLIKTLYIKRETLSQNHKKLHSADERFLHDAENMLYDEFAYALNIPKDEVISYIKQRVN